MDKDGKWVNSTEGELRRRKGVRSAEGGGMGVVAVGSANPSAGS
jgi:NAD+ synthase (glutamine-hydrolysing)